MAVGATFQFHAMGQFSDGSTRDITNSASWSSSDITKATIETSGQSNPGLATGISTGSVNITAQSSGQSLSVLLTVTNPGATLTAISIMPPTATISTGQTQQFQATGMFSDGSMQDITATVAWSSSNTSIATIQSSGSPNPGLATAGSLTGAAIITASSNGISNTATLNVAAQGAKTLTSIAVDPSPVFAGDPGEIAKVQVGATLQFHASGTYTDGSIQDLTALVAWGSSNTTVATIQSSGLASGVSPGIVTITASFSGLTSSTAMLGVESTLTIGSIAVTPNAFFLTHPYGASIAVGKTQQFRAVATFSSGGTEDITSTVAWSSSNPAVATISPGGQATGIAAGSATIVASLNGSTCAGDLTSPCPTLTVTAAPPNSTAIALTDFTAAQNYLSFSGGLYENVTDTEPADHRSDGVAAGSRVQPRDVVGNPNSTGKIVMLGIGMSNATYEYKFFGEQAANDPRVNHSTLAIVNGGEGGADAGCWTQAQGASPGCHNGDLSNQYDRVRDSVLAPLGLSEAQVQVLWVKNANGNPAPMGRPSLCDPTLPGCVNNTNVDPNGVNCNAQGNPITEAYLYECQLGQIIRAAKSRYPNLQQVFLATRIYAGYATTDLNPEPYAYEYGFSAKWMIQAQIDQIRGGKPDPIAGDLNYNGSGAPAAWADWGAYLWAHADTPRSDGVRWLPIDLRPGDGTHPSYTGRQIVSNLLVNLFVNSPLTPWFAAK